MTPWSIASGLCVGDTKGLYYVKPDIARIELFVHIRERFPTTLLIFCETIPGFCGSDCLNCVQVNRRCDVDRIDFLIRRKLMPVAIPSSGAELVCE